MSALAEAWEPLDDGAVTRLAARLSTAAVVGVGGTTREAAEVSAVQVALARALLDGGARVLVLLDAVDVVARLDAAVTGGGEPLEQVLRDAWGPWRVRPLLELLELIRRRNAVHPGDPVRLVGTTPAQAVPSDLDAVLVAASGLGAPERDAVVHHIGVIRRAHDGGEHALRAQGDHDGVPFVERARAVRTLVAPVADEDLLEVLDRVVAFHAGSLSEGGDPYAGANEAALRLVRDHVDAGRRVVVLDGIAHLLDPDQGLGSALRDLLGGGYRAVAITFGSGRIRDVELPEPAPGTVDGLLQGLGGDGVLHVDALGAAGRAELARARTVRLVSGMYRVDEDDRHRHPAGGLGVATAIVHLRTVTPVEEA